MTQNTSHRWTPRVTVAAVIADAAGRYLLVEEAPEGTPVLNQPAGHLEPNESLTEAVIREVREETGHAFSPTALVGIYRWQTAPQGLTYLRFCFTGDLGARLTRELDSDIRATHWLDAVSLTSGAWQLRSPMVLRCIRDAEAGQRHGLDILREMGIGHGQ